MQSTPRERLLQFSYLLQSVLFAKLEPEIGPLGEKARLLIAVLGMVSLARWIGRGAGWRGRPCKDRIALASAFVAKVARL